MNTASKGRATEAAFVQAFLQRGYLTSIPFGGGGPYDLVVEPAPGFLLRVQCKTARKVPNGCITFNCFMTDHGRGRLSYLGLADLFAVRYPAAENLYLVPVRETAALSGTLRVEAARNNQRRRVRLAADFEFGSWTTERLCELALVADTAQAA
jgi:hypothetical protein